MSYSARRGFSNGSMRPTGAQRQQEMQQKLQEMQEARSRYRAASNERLQDARRRMEEEPGEGGHQD